MSNLSVKPGFLLVRRAKSADRQHACQNNSKNQCNCFICNTYETFIHLKSTSVPSATAQVRTARSCFHLNNQSKEPSPNYRQRRKAIKYKIYEITDAAPPRVSLVCLQSLRRSGDP